ncbi:MAG: urease accessory protein UreD, partial [Solirubrobacteraceae bacterium]|nr:urease accessory protein UreD [Solirubrobacteraceae bacterium]
RGMKGGVCIRTELGDDGRTRITELTATAPFAAKITPEGVHLVGAAAAPLDGDHITIDLHIGAGTSLTVRTVAATMAWPSRDGRLPSLMELTANVEEGATLAWLPEPLVPVRRCRHELRTSVQLARTARLVWREEVILGRAHEGPGTLRAHTRVERAGDALLHQELEIDGSRGRIHGAPSVLGNSRATGSVLVVGPGAPDHHATVCTPELRGAVLELEGGGRLASASGASVAKLRSWLDEREAGLTAGAEWQQPHPHSTHTKEVIAP